MTDQEKLKLYKETLESIVLSGHTLQSTDDEGTMLLAVIRTAWRVLDKAGDIEAD